MKLELKYIATRITGVKNWNLFPYGREKVHKKEPKAIK